MRKLREGSRDYKIGFTWGSLTIDGPRFIKNHRGWFKCKCRCGNLVDVRCDWIKDQIVKSCGCDKNLYTSINHNKRKGTLLDQTGKVCAKCKIKKQKEDFCVHNDQKDKLCSWCIPCKKGKRLLQDYGITYQEYTDLFNKQEKACAICKTKVSKRFCVDHSHEGLKNVRGILCTNCNVGLGLLGDNIEGLQKALKYLQKFDKKEKLK